MRFLKIAVLVTAITGGSAALFADTINDPLIQFSSGGHHSLLIGGTGPGSSPQCDGTVKSCFVEIPDAIVDGGASLDVHNESGKAVTMITFFIPTINFDQVFEADSNLFLDALITLDVVHNETDVTFFGTGSGDDAFFLLDNTGTACEPNCAPGFANGSNANPPENDPQFNFRLEAFFGTPKEGSHRGLPNGGEATLDLSATVPEPATFGLLLGVLGLVAGSRKLRSRISRS